MTDRHRSPYPGQEFPLWEIVAAVDAMQRQYGGSLVDAKAMVSRAVKNDASRELERLSRCIPVMELFHGKLCAARDILSELLRDWESGA